MTQTVRVKKLRENAVLPSYGSDYAAGADLYACNAVTVEPGATEFVQTGLALEVPAGYAGLVYARSGLACKKGLAPANKVGVIDADYRGEIMVALYNHSSQHIFFKIISGITPDGFLRTYFFHSAKQRKNAFLVLRL